MGNSRLSGYTRQTPGCVCFIIVVFSGEMKREGWGCSCLLQVFVVVYHVFLVVHVNKGMCENSMHCTM